MRVISVEPGQGEPTLEDRPMPEPADGEVLVRTLRVGIDGTDREVIDGRHGGPPAGDDRLILGHEAVGVVEDPNGTALEAGTIVVPTVRRPADGMTTHFERDEADVAPAGTFVECGIDGAHGFMAEYFTADPAYLCRLPAERTPVGFLIEPISITEKAIEHAFASRAAFTWEPESALVIGNGSLGLLTLGMLETSSSFERTYCVGRRDRPDPTIDLIESLGSTYVDSRETPVDAIADVHEPMDFVYEATGYAKHAFQTIEALAPNGVGALLGVPDDWTFEVDGGKLHRSLVLSNKALVGSVNSNRGHFESAIDRLATLPSSFVDELVTDVHPVEDADRAFTDDDTTIKAAIEFASYEER